MSKEFICPNPNCGYKGEAKEEEYGSYPVGIFLLLLGIIPGVLYFMFKVGDRYLCPKCNLQVATGGDKQSKSMKKICPSCSWENTEEQIKKNEGDCYYCSASISPVVK